MPDKPDHSRKYLIPYRRNLRSNATPAERYLWKHIKLKQLDGLRFQRQHSINNYIVDFYCASHHLIIELDGEVHNNPIAMEKDAQRDAVLTGMGFTVLRFENKMAFEHLDDVFGRIREAVDKSGD
jgi:very-short-patch-repair endonuclease